ncbi:MAG: carbamate kinase, partial [Anaerolineae bacterium]
QVGFILRRNELASREVHTTPLDLIGADTQGAIGYMLAQALDNEFHRRQIKRQCVAVVTQVVVDANDPGFKNPTKGIGGFADEASARRFEAEGWIVQEDAGRGWRRVIASPIPRRIVELDAIRGLVDMGYVVISVGGGGIPVFENQKGELRGCVGAMGAVIDKDRASGLLAAELGVDLLLISTGVEQVAINFNKPNQQWLDRLTLAEAKRYHAEGHFLKGSMGPKIEAAIEYLEKTPHGQALITNPENIARALAGETGTWIVNE